MKNNSDFISLTAAVRSAKSDTGRLWENPVPESLSFKDLRCKRPVS